MEKISLLICEDDSSVRRVLVRTFEQAGFDVSAAANGEKAVPIIESKMINVMISDINMPRMTGRDLCKHLADNGPYLPECIFIVTSRTEEDERAWVSEFPGIKIVEKPVGPRQILRLVNEHLAMGVTD